MLARARLIGSGALIGAGLARAARALSDRLDEDPDALHEVIGPTLARYLPPRETPAKDYTSIAKQTVALVKMSGSIAAPTSSALGDQGKIHLGKFDAQLKSAFRTPNCAAVAIEMNSPGGSPVQSALVHNRLRALREEHPDVPLLCFVTDCCASGGYYIASACDEIHVMPSSIVGSIGVVSPSVGVAALLKQYGVEDRTMTAGTSKKGDSPLQPRDPIAVAQKQQLLEELHEDFKSKVAAARGEKLKHDDAYTYQRRLGERKSRKARAEALFDGSVYAGRTAVSLGLADALYDEMGATLRGRFGDVRVRELKSKVGFFEKLQALQEAGAEANATALVRGARLELARVAAESIEL